MWWRTMSIATPSHDSAGQSFAEKRNGALTDTAERYGTRAIPAGSSIGNGPSEEEDR